MFSNPFSMVVAIVAIVMFTSIIKTRIRAKHGISEDQNGRAIVTDTADAKVMREEIKALKDRIAVLERVITDQHSSVTLEQEIEKLR